MFSCRDPVLLREHRMVRRPRTIDGHGAKSGRRPRPAAATSEAVAAAAWSAIRWTGRRLDSSAVAALCLMLPDARRHYRVHASTEQVVYGTHQVDHLGTEASWRPESRARPPSNSYRSNGYGIAEAY